MQKSSMEVWLRRAPRVLIATAAIVTAACGGGGGGGSSGTTASAQTSTSGGNTAPKISGTPQTSAAVGAAYSFQPTATDANGDTLAFAIENRPTWASFNTTTGRLSGTPADAGTTASIVISVSDGKSSAALPAFSITVGSAPADSGSGASLSWDIPTQTTEGENLADLTGFRIHYGVTSSALSEAVEVPSPGMNTYTVGNLKPGTYYFAVCAIRANGTESAPSNIIKRVIT